MKKLFFMLLVSASLCAQGNLLKDLGFISSEKNEEKSDSIQPCSSPYAALKATLASMGAEKIACFEKYKTSNSELYTVVDRLKAILKNSEFEIDFEEVPNQEDYRDNRGQRRFSVVSMEPKIYLAKEGREWIFHRASIQAINEHYANTLNFTLIGLQSYLPSWMNKDIFGITNLNFFHLLLLLIIAGIGSALRFAVAALACWQIKKFFSYREAKDELKKMAKPLGNLAMAGFFLVCIPALDLNLVIVHYLDLLVRLFSSISFVLLLYYSVEIIAFFVRGRTDKSAKIDNQIISLFSTGIKVIIWVLGSIFILQSININATSLLAGVTIGGLAFSFAARDTVANLFGSITVFTDKSFSIGDWIKINEVEGIVEYVGFRSTRIRTFTDSLVCMPNSKFTDSFVENFSVRKYRRASSELTITNSNKPQQIEAFCNGIRGLIVAHPATRKDKFEVHLSGYEGSNLKIMVNFYSEVASLSEELRVRHEIYLDILRLADKLSIQFSSPNKVYVLPPEALSEEEKTHERQEDELKAVVKDFGPEGKEIIKPGPRLGEAFFPKSKT